MKIIDKIRMLKNLRAEQNKLKIIATELQKEIFILYTQKGMTQQEVADMLRIKQTKVSQALHSLAKNNPQLADKIKVSNKKLPQYHIWRNDFTQKEDD